MTHEGKDLEVKITEDLKPHAQCKLAASKASRAIGTLEETFKFRSPELWKTLYVTYVRTQLELQSRPGHHIIKPLLEILKRVQRRATKVISGFSQLPYEERLRRLDTLTTLYKSRIRGDLIQMYKFKNDIDEINWCNDIVPVLF